MQAETFRRAISLVQEAIGKVLDVPGVITTTLFAGAEFFGAGAAIEQMFPRREAPPNAKRWAEEAQEWARGRIKSYRGVPDLAVDKDDIEKAKGVIREGRKIIPHWHAALEYLRRAENLFAQDAISKLH